MGDLDSPWRTTTFARLNDLAQGVILVLLEEWQRLIDYLAHHDFIESAAEVPDAAADATDAPVHAGSHPSAAEEGF